MGTQPGSQSPGTRSPAPPPPQTHCVTQSKSLPSLGVGPCPALRGAQAHQPLLRMWIFYPYRDDPRARHPPRPLPSCREVFPGQVQAPRLTRGPLHKGASQAQIAAGLLLLTQQFPMSLNLEPEEMSKTGPHQWGPRQQPPSELVRKKGGEACVL